MEKIGKIIKKQRSPSIPITSFVDQDKILFELLYDHDKHQTRLACWNRDKWEIKSSFLLESGQRIVPYAPENPLLNQKIILFPDDPWEYGEEERLIGEIRSFIHRYVDVSEIFELISTYYVLLSWVYDTFNEIPYLRLRGDYGSGKTRFLQTVGSICFKPIFASGASTVAPLFHILNQVGGTLILDEGDFRFSDEKADIAKILNNGNAKGFPVLRCEKINQREFAPKAYNVFSPKIVASRNDYDDLALESRFISEDMGFKRIRNDIPLTLPSSFSAEALALRNKLLLWRFKNYGQARKAEAYVDRKLEQRINQIIVPLLTLMPDARERKEVLKFARIKNEQIRSDRGFQVEADLLSVIKEISAQSKKDVSISEITQAFIEKHGSAYDRQISPKWIGSMVRKKLRLSTRKKNGIYILNEGQVAKLKRLYQKYNI